MSRTLEALPPEVDLKTLRKVILAASIGNFVEWFDFAAYGFLATILTREFFPSGDPAVGLLKTFAVFAVAFAFRPLGGIVFGVIGDRIGRKRTLALTILLMAGATTLIGLLPTYAAIGAFAPLLLTVIRCVQGFSAGGEYAGACAYVMEHAPQHKRARYGSFVPVSTFSSFATAAVVAYALDASLSADAMSTWGWRVPFLAAAPIGLIGLYLRMNLNETPAFRALEGEHEVAHAPLRDTLRTQAPGILKLGAFISVTALSFYMFTTYFATYLQVAGGLNRATSLLITVIALLFAAALCPLAGLYSDLVGRRKTVLTACVILIATVYPSFSLAGSGHFLPSVIGVGLLAIGAVLSGVVTAPLLSEVFPTRTRYTASAITYNLAYTVFGGTAPLVATWLITTTGNNMSPALYLIVISVMGLVGGLMLPETSKVSLHGASLAHPDATAGAALKSVPGSAA
ncbi:MFS transporter [Caballeronia mineralivorans]|jgi:MHS family proline/betaine transporter-like MFS transporter|uniref:MFS transporter n=1 Tax=Caballeronia mineralivorans TaxID=2010198 RepID=UPI0023EFFFF2|nr:MFS transporter [Caballeronia mineralivorans]MDB5788495.1 transporter [Caballeronia mineralivorans]MEA3101188.1 transporter, family, proline/betaine transporter [Caballeronia mineralivorans]